MPKNSRDTDPANMPPHGTGGEENRNDDTHEPAKAGFVGSTDSERNVASGEIKANTRNVTSSGMAGLKVIDFDALALIHRAHDKVAAVLSEGTSNLPKAFMGNVARDRQNLKDGIAGGVLGGTVALLTGDPIFFVALAPLGFLVRNIWNTARIRMRREKLSGGDMKDLEASELPELKNAWDLTCWKFVRLVKGYNARVHAVNRIRENRRKEGGQELLRIADGWDKLLRDVYDRLEDVCADLQKHQSLIYSNQLEELDDNIRNADLLGYFDGVPMLDWLDNDHDRILISQAPRVYRSDMEARAELRDLYERRKESFADLENFLQGTIPIFDKLDREHGPAVDAIREEKNWDDEEDSDS